MSVALRNTRKQYVNAMVRVNKQQKSTQPMRHHVYVSATSIGSIAPGQVFILPFHVELAEGGAEAVGDACAEVDVEVVIVSDEDMDGIKRKQEQEIGVSEPNSNLFWTTLPPPPSAQEWGAVSPPPSVRCRKSKNSSFRFTFVAHDGAAAEAAAVPPRDGTCVRSSSPPSPRDNDSCPIVVTMHGTGVSCNDAADAYKLQNSDGSWLFGIRYTARSFPAYFFLFIYTSMCLLLPILNRNNFCFQRFVLPEALGCSLPQGPLAHTKTTTVIRNLVD